MGYYLLLSLIILMLKLTQILTVGALQNRLLCHFDMGPSLLSTAFTTSCSWLLLYFPCPSSGSASSLRKLGSFSCRIFRSQDLGAKCMQCYWSVASPRPSQWTELGNICFCFCFFNIVIYLFIFIFGCVGSSFLGEGFLQFRRAGATLHRGARASHRRGLSRCGAQAPDAQAQ